MKLLANDKLYFRIITIISVAIPAVVALLLFMPKQQIQSSFDIGILPKMNALINSTVSVLLVLGYIAIRKGRKERHKALMLTAFSLSALFLISYVLYHSVAGDARFGGQGWIRPVYFFILISHILLATAIVPLVLVTIYRSTSGQLQKHRKIARWTLPLWLYVSVTGVIVYLMISPYYTH